MAYDRWGGSWGSSWALTWTGEEAVAPAVTPRTGGGRGAKGYKRYPRRLFLNGQVVTVRNADEERRLLTGLAERADEQAKMAAALGDDAIAAVAQRKALKLKRRAVSADDRESQWLDYLRNEDDEILTILLH